MRSLWRLGVERPGGISFELAFIPFLTAGEVEGPRQDYNCALVIGMPMRRILPAGRELNARNEQSWLCRVAVQDYALRWARQRTFELNVLWQLEDARVGVLRVDGSRDQSDTDCG